MKITHIVLCGPVTDGWTYQDNLLPKYHKKLGYQVSLVTSKYVYNQNGELEIDPRDKYINDNEIKIVRLKNKYGTTINSKFKVYKNLYKTLIKEEPDILFVHGVQFLDIKVIIKYLKNNSNLKVYVDNHADFSNSASNWLSKNILHKIIWRHYANLIEPYVNKFYGVLPSRVDFLKELYHLPQEKIELLVMGVDDEKIKEAKKNRLEIRNNYHIKPNDFLIVTGGKIDYSKRQTLLLMQAVKKIKSDNIKLIVFGSVDSSLRDEFNDLVDNEKVQYAGWINSSDTYNYFGASDLVVFPGRHSVFWEQVAGLGIPMVIKYWEGTTHINVGGNCEFLYKDSVEEIISKIESIVKNDDKYEKMKKVAQSKGKKRFMYSNIAKESLR